MDQPQQHDEEHKESREPVGDSILSILGLLAGGIPPILAFFRLLVVGDFDPDLISVLLSTLDIPAIVADELSVAVPFILFCASFAASRSLMKSGKNRNLYAIAFLTALAIVCFAGFVFTPVMYSFGVTCGVFVGFALTGKSASLREAIVSIITFGGFMAFTLIFAWARLDNMWLPAEAIETHSGKHLVYVLAVDDHDITVMFHGNKQVEVFRADEIFRRDICDSPEISQIAINTMSVKQLISTGTPYGSYVGSPKMPPCEKLLRAP